MTPENAKIKFEELGPITVRKALRYLRRAALKMAILAGRPPFEEGYERGFKDALQHGFKLGYEKAQNESKVVVGEDNGGALIDDGTGVKSNAEGVGAENEIPSPASN